MKQYAPFPYQAYDIRKLHDLPAVALWLDMGLGKTSITETAVASLKYDYLRVHKVLVVAPKKVAEATWQEEAAKWEHLNKLRFATMLGTEKQRLAALYAAADIYIINRDNVAWLVDYCQNSWPFDMVVLDESSSFKSHSAKRFKKLKAVRPHIRRIVELTGTPAPQGYLDLWAQIYLLDSGERLGKSFSAYREAFFVPATRSRTQIFTYKLRDGAKEEIDRRLSDICISMKAEDYLTLPPLMKDDIPVVLDAPAQRAYDSLERDAVLELACNEVISATMAATLTGKLLQLCNGAVYDENHRAHLIHDCKLEAFKELLEQLAGAHALVFYNFRHDKDRILAALAKSGLRVVTMDQPDAAQRWNAGEVDILLAHPASCAYGLNLQYGGHHIIWFGLNWSLELMLQANKRLHRQGQQLPVIIHRLIVRGGVDEDVVAALDAKGNVQESLLQGLKARIEKVQKEMN